MARPADRRSRAVAWLLPRARLVGSAAAVGAVAGGLAVAALLVVGLSRRAASTQAFALAALALGLGLLGWSGSAMAGRGVESMQRHLETGTDWTEADSRRAMARIGGFGAGGMVGASLLTTVVGLL